MSLKLSMWNVHSWLQTRQIAHSISIRDNDALIAGVRLHNHNAAGSEQYAILSEMTSKANYHCMLTFADNYIYFRDYSVFHALDEINYMFTIYRRWEQALKQLNLVYCNMDSLLDLSYEVMPYPLDILQNGQKIAASPRFQKEIEAFEHSFINNFLSTPYSKMQMNHQEDQLPSDGTPLLLHSTLHSGKQVILGTIRLSAQPVRFLALSNGRPISIGDIHFARILMEALLCNLKLWKQRIISRESAFFVSLLNSEQPQIKPEDILRLLHWQSNHRYTVFWFERKSGSDSILLDRLFVDLDRHFPFAFVLSYQNAVLLICNLDLIDRPPTETDFSPHAAHFVIGQSNISADFSLIAQLMRQAHTTMQHARRQNVFFLSAESIMLDYMHQVFYQDAMLQSLIHPAIRYLMELDRAQQSQLLDTLRAYLFYGGNCNAAAKALHLHRNSLVHRLEQISVQAHIDLDNAVERQALLLSLYVAAPLLPQETEIPSHTPM